MSKIFSKINSFNSQNKKAWIDNLKKENINIEDLQHNLNHKFYGPIYFKEEIKKNYSFKKKKGWRITHSTDRDNINSSNKNAIQAIQNGAESIFFTLKIYFRKCAATN